MDTFPQGDLSRCRVIRMRAVIVYCQASVDLKDTSVITPKGELPESIFRNIDVAGKNIAEMVCIRSTGNVWLRHHTTVDNR